MPLASSDAFPTVPVSAGELGSVNLTVGPSELFEATCAAQCALVKIAKDVPNKSNALPQYNQDD